MKYIVLILLLSVLLVDAKVYNPKDLKQKPLNPAKKIKALKTTLPNGIRLYVYEDHTLPVFEMTGFYQAGNLYQPINEFAIPNAALNQMAIGGTINKTPEEVEEWLENNAVSIRFNAGMETCNFSLRCLKDKRKEMLNLFKDMLLYPRFDEKRIDLFKKQQIENLKRTKEKPWWLGFTSFGKYMYGEDTIWGYEPDDKDFLGINRDMLIAWHKKWVYPARMYIAVVGDFNAEEMVQEITALLGSWQVEAPTIPQIPKVKDEHPKGVYLISKEVTQAAIILGHFGIKRWHPQDAQIDMFNQIFGYDGFSSRLTQEVRNSQGLAYAIWGGIGNGIEKGLFRVACFTQPKTVPLAIDGIIKVIKEMQAQAQEESTIQLYREKFENQWGFRYENPLAVLSNMMVLDFYSRPEDQDEQDLNAFLKVSAAEVKDAANNFIHLDDLFIVVVGPASLKGELERFGKVTVIEETNREGDK